MSKASKRGHRVGNPEGGLGAVSWTLSVFAKGRINKTLLLLAAIFLAFSLDDAKAQSNSASSLGTNLGVASAGSSEQPFLNIFKLNTGWAGNISGGGRADPEIKQSVFDLDADGWPKSFNGVGANAGKTYTEIDTNVLVEIGTHNPNGSVTGTFYRAGTYICLYDGAGSLSYVGDAVKVRGTAGRDVLNVATPSRDGIQIMITSTDPGHTGNYIRNIRLVYQGPAYDGEALLSAGEIFNPDFLARVAPFKMLRFLDWLSPDSDNNGSWSARRQPTYFNWTGHVPIEVLVAAANKIGADAWFHMPVMSDDDYVTRYATLVHSGGTDTSGRVWPGLNSNLKAYVEYGNEMWQDNKSWRTNFPTLPDVGWAAFSCAQNDYNAVLIYATLRAVQNGATWKSAWGTDASRVVRVLGGQSGYQGRNEYILSFTAGQYCGDPSKFAGTAGANVDAFATAPYFGLYAVPNTFTLDQFFTEMMSGGLVPRTSGGYAGGMIKQALDGAALDYIEAQKYNLPLLAYEGGQTFIDYSGTDSALQQLYYAANHDPRMGTVYTTYLNGWKTLGGTIFNNFTNIGYDSRWGYWGALENVLQTSSPKYDALLNFISNNPCWWNGCSAASSPSSPSTPSTPPTPHPTTPSTPPTSASSPSNPTAPFGVGGGVSPSSPTTPSTPPTSASSPSNPTAPFGVGGAASPSNPTTPSTPPTSSPSTPAPTPIGTPTGPLPAVSINSPTNGTTANGNVNIAASASSTIGIASLMITADGNQLAACTNVTFCATTWQRKKITKGTHSIGAVAIDHNGGHANTSVLITVPK
jgi:hypothetical protein